MKLKTIEMSIKKNKINSYMDYLYRHTQTTHIYAIRRGKTLIYKRRNIRFKTNLSFETIHARREWNTIFKILNEKPRYTTQKNSHLHGKEG